MKLKIFSIIFMVAMLLACGGSDSETPDTTDSGNQNAPAATATPEAVEEPTEEPTEEPVSDVGADWVEVSSDAGQFAVLMPNEPNEQSQQVPSLAGNIEMVMFVTEADESAYIIAYNDIPEELLPIDDVEQMLDDARDGGLSNMGGQMTNEESITLDGHPGRNISFEIPAEAIPGGGEGFIRLFVTDSRLYQVMVLGSKGKLPPEDVDLYFGSFELIE